MRSRTATQPEDEVDDTEPEEEAVEDWLFCGCCCCWPVEVSTAAASAAAAAEDILEVLTAAEAAEEDLRSRQFFQLFS